MYHKGPPNLAYTFLELWVETTTNATTMKIVGNEAIRFEMK